MGKKILLSGLLSALLLFFVVPGFAQESTVKGTLAGVVLDSSGAVVQGATLTLNGPTGNSSVQSDSNGHFSFPLLTPGVYGLKVERQGFKAADVKGVEVVTGRTSSLRMQLEPGGANETVEVTANAVTVDTTSTASGANLNDAFYASVPVPRNVSGLFYVAPGVADSGRAGRANPSISGGSGLENLYVADGVNITDPAFGGLGVFTRTYGSVGSGINLSFIKEVQVKTGGFEPQYGQSTGGVVQIVTKSGGDAYHGALAGYFAPVSTAASPKNIDSFRNNFTGSDAFTSTALVPAASGLLSGPGSYDVDGELGGYIPGFKNHLFFFGSFNPTLNTDYETPPATAGNLAVTNNIPSPVGLATLFGNRPIYTRAWTNNYAAKLTFKINSSQSFETSLFGDPTSTNSTAFRTLVAPNTSVFSSQQYQTRNWVARYNATLSPTWLVNANFTWSHNEFTETPQAPNVFNIVDRTTQITPTIEGLGFVENHNADNFGYEIDTSKSVHFLGTHTFSVGGSETFLNYNDLKSRTGGTFSLPTVPTPVNATFSLRQAKPGVCPQCPFFTDPQGVSVPVFLLSARSEFGPPTVATEGLAMALYGSDSWTINKHLSFNLGLRWDQYHMAGVQSKYTFTDNWAPRLGVAYDPIGDRKSKIYLNWARYNYQMPLDAAIRSLSQELDLSGLRLAPIINSDGSITVSTDAAHILNGTPAFPNGFTTSAQALEGFAPGTKMQYEDEYVAGVEHDMGHGVVLSARYLDRRLRRVVEDMGGVSPEASLATLPDGSVPLQQLFLIGNPSSSLDLFTNEPKPVIQPLNAPCAGALATTDANGNNFPGNVQACFNTVNGINGLVGGTPTADGIADGFANPVRNYQAVEFEMNKGFSSGWLMRLNYRLAYLRGNYEGAFRNDNGQTDPSISSLFDFTTGSLNLLGDQFAVGPLNTDRHHVANAFFSYTFSKSMIKGLTLGTGMRLQSGTPISEFADHPAYGNSGEVPLGGRGKLGRTQPSGAIDLHSEYARKMTERFTFRVGADLFNVTNSQPVTLVDQNRDLSFNSPGSNLDFQSPLSFQNPFYSRFSVKLEF